MKKRMMTQMKKKSHQDWISPDIIRQFFSNFTRNCQKPSFKIYLQQLPHNLKALLPPQIKSKKRKRRSSKTDESDCFINCVKTYWQKLNEEILSQNQFISNGGLENLGGKPLCKKNRISQSNLRWYHFFWSSNWNYITICNFRHSHRCIPMSCTALMFSN